MPFGRQDDICRNQIGIRRQMRGVVAEKSQINDDELRDQSSRHSAEEQRCLEISVGSSESSARIVQSIRFLRVMWERLVCFHSS